ncbi:MAG TPA: M3 family metallopeptidase [Actinomycetales bacterium]|nr:M3 family metallopeptidase [Actinomycetales bacterium]
MTNPVLTPSELPYDLPDFTRIADEHFLPAFEAAMEEHRAQIEDILANPEPATIENTLIALERSGRSLERVAATFFNQASSHATEPVKAVEEEIVPRLTAHQDAINLDPRLWRRIDALYQRRDELDLDAETDRLLAETRRDLLRDGAALADAQRAQLADFNAQLARLTTAFGQRLLEDTNANAVIVDDATHLAGIAPATVATYAQAAARRNLPEGHYAIELGLPTVQPVLANAQNRDLRERIYRASINRGANGGETDTRELVAQIVSLRARRAELLGHPNHASLVADEGTAQTTAAISELMDALVPVAVQNVKKEAADLQSALEQDHPGEKLQPWDWAFYEEKIRAERYAVDDATTKPYFELGATLNKGIFFAATCLYGITFKHRADLVGYHEDVDIYEVLEEDGTGLGLFLFDPYTRETKYGGAWMNDLVGQSRLLGEKAVIVNNLNITKPPAGEATLLTIDEVTTLFHEFGHALHGLLSDVYYPSFTGTSVPRDVVEFPSQVNEMWMLDPQVLANYARHYETGEVLPEEIAQKLIEAQIYGQGFSTTEFLAAALLDQAWHRLSAQEASHIKTAQDVTTFENQALQAAGVALDELYPRYRSNYFAHTFSGGYDAGYYSYIWAEVLDADCVEWFKENGGLRRENGQRFRDALLGRGGSADMMDLYRALRGRDARLEPLLTRRGLTR